MIRASAAGRRGRATSPELTSVVTHGVIPAAPDAVWRALVWYEEIEDRPPWFLRLILPLPLGTEGPRARIGDEARCVYRTGHLRKRVTELEPGRHYGFDVIEQRLALGGGIALAGGCYRLSGGNAGPTEVELETRYAGGRRPRWLWRRVEAVVCSAFHRWVLDAMRRRLVAAGGVGS